VDLSAQFRDGSFLFTLEDGKTILVGPVLPEDRERIRIGLTRMSSSSRYLRFFTATPQLTEEQLRYLTELDQVNHVAWAALDPDDPQHPGLGLGRFVRTEEKGDLAELAMAAIDSYQNRGLGRILLAVLYLRCRQLGVRVLRGLVLPENRFVVRWFRDLGGTPRLRDGLEEVDLPVYDDMSLLPRTASAERFRNALRAVREKLSSGSP
jgi:GNAT superfamily N-acetyltransferase